MNFISLHLSRVDSSLRGSKHHRRGELIALPIDKIAAVLHQQLSVDVFYYRCTLILLDNTVTYTVFEPVEEVLSIIKACGEAAAK